MMETVESFKQAWKELAQELPIGAKLKAELEQHWTRLQIGASL